MTRRTGLAVVAGAIWGLFARKGMARPLKSDEEVLFPTGTARLLPDGRVEVSISAWVFEFERRRGARAIFTRALGLETADLSPEAQAIFAQRSRYFLTDSERGKDITLHFDSPAGQQAQLPPTDRAGRSTLRLALICRAAPALVQFHATRPSDGRRFPGRAIFVPDQGLSVLSDIDDTIKDSNVLDRNNLMVNTFFNAFKPVPEMAARYRALAQADPATRFHYLSNSPLQLLPALQDFLETQDFPDGSLHLRESTAWNRLVPTGARSRNHKPEALAGLLADFPRRRFLLIGDSGEEDPETYAALARAHPEREVTILIRALRGESRETPRMTAAFAGLPAARWHLFAASGGDWPL